MRPTGWVLVGVGLGVASSGLFGVGRMVAVAVGALALAVGAIMLVAARRPLQSGEVAEAALSREAAGRTSAGDADAATPDSAAVDTAEAQPAEDAGPAAAAVTSPEAADAEPAPPEKVPPDLAASEPAPPDPAVTEPALPEPAPPEKVPADLAAPEAAPPDPAVTEPVLPEPVPSEPAAAEVASPEPTAVAPAPDLADTEAPTPELLPDEPEIDQAAAPRPSPLRFPPLRLGDVEFADIGIPPSATAEEVAGQAVAPYVRRAVDDALDRALSPTELARTGGVVVARGAPCSGVTRTLWEALRRHAGDRTVVAVGPPVPSAAVASAEARSADGDGPAEQPLPWLADLLESGELHLDDTVVLWIDDAHEHLGRGLTLETLDRLVTQLPGAIVALTASAWRLRLPELVPDPVERWLRLASDRHELGPQLTDDEFAAAVASFPGQTLNPRLRWLPAWFAETHLLRDRYREAHETAPVHAAVVRAAAVWQRAGLPAVVTTDAVRALVAAGSRSRAGRTPNDDALAKAICWAADEVAAGRALLAPLDPASDDTTPADAASAFRAASAVADDVLTLDGPIRTGEWQAVLDLVTPREAIDVARAALAVDESEAARQALRRASESGSDAEVAVAGRSLGILLEQDRAYDEAERAYRRVVDTGDPEHAPAAAFQLGGVLEELGHSGEAVTAYQQAIASGHPDVAPMAAFNLGWLHEHHRRPEEAEHAYQRAIDTGHGEAGPMASYNLAGLLERQRRLREAETLYRAALDSGHHDVAPMAAVSLAALLERLQRGREARELLERAAASDHAEAATAARLRLKGRRRR